MDLDRYLSLHRPSWDRLAHLSARARRGPRRLAPEELDELVSLYQRASGHLVHVRAVYGDARVEARLTGLVAGAHAAIYGSRTPAGTALRRFVTATFPGAVWRIRAFVAVAALVTFAPALALGTWIATSDAALEATAPQEVRDAYVRVEFEDYYSSEPASQFAAEVTFNNIQVAVGAFALGIFLCIGTATLLAFNGANVGLAGGLFAAAGESERFFGLILPHGLLELTAVVVAGAAGLRLGWAVIDPGDLPRGAALAAEGRRSMAVVLGVAAAFVVAGLIEGFVTGSSLPDPVRVGVGVVAEAGAVAYVVRYGRTAEAAEAAAATP